MITESDLQREIELADSMLKAVEPQLIHTLDERTSKRQVHLLVSAAATLLLAIGLVTLKDLKALEVSADWKDTSLSAVISAALVTLYFSLAFSAGYFQNAKLLAARAVPTGIRLRALIKELANRRNTAQAMLDEAFEQATQQDPATKAEVEILEEEINGYRSRSELPPQELMDRLVAAGSRIVPSLTEETLRVKSKTIQEALNNIKMVEASIEPLAKVLESLAHVSATRLAVELWLPMLVSLIAVASALLNAFKVL